MVNQASEKKETFPFIEGVRGVAAIIVVIAHYSCAFLPAFYGLDAEPHFAWEYALSHSPAFVFSHPEIAVYIFFLMSGFVLAPSFSKVILTVPKQALKRFIRLFIPVACSAAIAFVLLLAFPSARLQAANITGSTWLADFCANPMTFGSVTKDIFLSSMLAGYDLSSIFTGSHIFTALSLLEPSSYALNTPVWTLHAEFWGSMLILFLATIHRRFSSPLYAVVCVVVFAFVGTSQYALFIFGFLAYQCRGAILLQRGKAAIAASAFLFGIGCYCFYWLPDAATGHLITTIGNFTFLTAKSPRVLKGEIAACLVLLSIAAAPTTRHFFSRKIFLWLGKISFSIYLVHFPILFTIGSRFFVALSAHVSYGLALTLTFAAMGTLTVIAASLFDRIVDEPAIKMARCSVGVRLRKLVQLSR